MCQIYDYTGNGANLWFPLTIVRIWLVNIYMKNNLFTNVE